VEIDATFVGGKHKNRHNNKQEKGLQGRSTKRKNIVFGAVERKGKLIAKMVKNTKAIALIPHIKESIKEDSYIMSDEWCSYKSLYKNYIHYAIKHKAGQYVDGKVHTNTIEVFGLFETRITLDISFNNKEKTFAKIYRRVCF